MKKAELNSMLYYFSLHIMGDIKCKSWTTLMTAVPMLYYCLGLFEPVRQQCGHRKEKEGAFMRRNIFKSFEQYLSEPCLHDFSMNLKLPFPCGE